MALRLKDKKEKELDKKRKEALKSQKKDVRLDTDREQAKGYRLDKDERRVRRKVYERFWAMRDDPLRVEAEADWKEGDKAFRQHVEAKTDDDWRADIRLPDAFAAIQAQQQETLARKSRPRLDRTQDDDKAIEEFGNAILMHNMDRMGFDYQYNLAKLNASIKGTGILKDYWRHEERTVKDPDKIDDETGELMYKEKTIIDVDDDYTEFIENEYFYVDPDAADIDSAADCIQREVLDLDSFDDIYAERIGFKNTEYVSASGETTNRSFFKKPEDMTEDQVEVLHYWSARDDEYLVVANNLPIYSGPLPSKHKQLPFAVIYQYKIPGQFWGMGIPKVIFQLTEERRSIRNLNMDRQKLQASKMFITNNAFSLDEEDLITRPHGIIGVDTHGQPLNQVIQPLEYGDIPFSYFRTEEILLEDIRRAHGIDDRIQGVNIGGTATEAAILKESSLKRVNMVAELNEIDALTRIGRLKWSNIQFYYPAPRYEKIFEKNKTKDQKVTRKISVQGKKFRVVDENGKKSLKMEDVEGKSSLALDKGMVRFLEGDWDVQIEAGAFEKISKPIKQAKTTEMFNMLMANPNLAAVVDPQKSVTRYLEINDEDPKNWLLGSGQSEEEQVMLAELENEAMRRGIALEPTIDAGEAHTQVHLLYVNSAEFEQLDPAIQDIFENHIDGEIQGQPGGEELLAESDEELPGEGNVPGLPTLGEDGLGIQPEAGPGNQLQAADLQPTDTSV